MTHDATSTISRSYDGAADGDSERELPRLVLALDCRHPLAPPARFVLEDLDEVAIGRGPARAWRRTGRRLEIELADHEASRRHVRVQRRDDSWELADLDSKNGTSVNGTSAMRATLADGDVVEVGSTLFVFRDEPSGVLRDFADLDLADASTLPAAFQTLAPALEACAADLAKIAPSTVPVLLRGETGTGKELTAQAIHQLSGRRGAFVAVNCGALPRTLIESELFGSRRGAFSGAREDREGLVRRADGGTLFLDEIAELPEESQVALLRVLQEGEVRPVGASESVRVDVRIVAATHQDLEARITEGRFRQDLYGRLLGYVATLPALRHRREDIGLLVGVLLRRAAGVDAPALQRHMARCLLAYPYPLNIRELEQALRAAVALAEGGTLRFEHLPEAMRGYRPAASALRPEDRALRDRLAELLREHRGNISAVGRALGKAPIQVRRWCRRFDLPLADFR